jgi:hypothetical protein
MILRLYRRAVRRSMSRASAGGGRRRAADADADRPAGAAAAVAPVNLSAGATAPSGDAAALLEALVARPRRAALVYACAAVAYGGVIAIVTAWFADPDAPFLPVRLLLLTTLFAWPIVPTLAIVAGSLRRRKIAIAGCYAAVYVALVLVGTMRSADFTVRQGIQLWALYNLPGTALIALCLSRRVRAVGPLVLLFLILGLLGADALLGVVGASTGLLRASVSVGGLFGLGGVGTFVGLIVAGFIALGVVGMGLLAWIRRRYEAKRLSDESLTVATMWWLFAFGDAVGLAFEHPLAPLSGVAAMIAFTAVSRAGFAYTGRPAGAGRKLLLLRSFSIGARGERLFDALEKHWRRVGSIQMIAGYDLASRTIEPHEFLDFVTGKLARRFIDGDEALQRRLAEADDRPDRDGRFRVNDFFCYDDTWRSVLSSLVHDSHAVLMDLRGFSPRNAGCVFEIGELFRMVPLERVLFVVDGRTDTAFLDDTFRRASATASRARSAAAPMQPRVLTCETLDTGTLDRLLVALAIAAGSAGDELTGTPRTQLA